MKKFHITYSHNTFLSRNGEIYRWMMTEQMPDKSFGDSVWLNVPDRLFPFPGVFGFSLFSFYNFFDFAWRCWDDSIWQIQKAVTKEENVKVIDYKGWMIEVKEW